MKIYIPGPLPDHPETLIRRAGYAEHRDSHSPEISYTHRLGQEFYPRYHVYIQPAGDGVYFNLHVDQKRASYGVGHTHSGEYEGPLVEREAKRLEEFVRTYQAPPVEEDKPKGFFGRLFSGGGE